MAIQYNVKSPPGKDTSGLGKGLAAVLA